MNFPSDQKSGIKCSAIILSGGQNTRMDGRNKAFLEVDGDSILNRLLAGLTPRFKEILLVTRQPDLYADVPVRVVTDLYEARSSLTGVHSGLVHSAAEYAFVVPCDAPLLQPAVIELLLNALDPEIDVVVPELEGHYEPLCAIYSKRCIPVIEHQLRRDDFKIINLFDRMNVKALSEEQIAEADPELLSFFNVNTPSAYQVCRKLLRKK